jgi:hypothetical protein
MLIIVQFSDWGYKKPTRIWGTVEGLQNRLCPGFWCEFAIPGTKRHFHRLGGNNYGVTRNEKYRVPENLVKFLVEGKRLEERHIPKEKNHEVSRESRRTEATIEEKNRPDLYMHEKEIILDPRQLKVVKISELGNFTQKSGRTQLVMAVHVTAPDGAIFF